MRFVPRFSVATLLLLIPVAALIAWQNTRESISSSDPYYAPLMGAAWHPPPYHIKELAIDYHIEQGWPIWHARSTYGYAAHNAGWDIVDGVPPERRPKRINWLRLCLNVIAWSGILVLTGVVSEVLFSRFRHAASTSSDPDTLHQRDDIAD